MTLSPHIAVDADMTQNASKRVILLMLGLMLCEAPSSSPNVLDGLHGRRDVVLANSSPYGLNASLLDPPGWATSHTSHAFATFANHRQYVSMWKAGHVGWLRINFHRRRSLN